MNRRGFLGSILALGAAPAIVRADSIMKIWTPPQELVIPAEMRIVFGYDVVLGDYVVRMDALYRSCLGRLVQIGADQYLSPTRTKEQDIQESLELIRSEVAKHGGTFLPFPRSDTFPGCEVEYRPI